MEKVQIKCEVQDTIIDGMDLEICCLCHYSYPRVLSFYLNCRIKNKACHSLYSFQGFFMIFFRVVTLNMSPVDDTFISGSLDKTIRIWDLRSPNCQVLCTNYVKIIM